MTAVLGILFQSIRKLAKTQGRRKCPITTSSNSLATASIIAHRFDPCMVCTSAKRFLICVICGLMLLQKNETGPHRELCQQVNTSSITWRFHGSGNFEGTFSAGGLPPGSQE